jgi:hypothetical protein
LFYPSLQPFKGLKQSLSVAKKGLQVAAKIAAAPIASAAKTTAKVAKRTIKIAKSAGITVVDQKQKIQTGFNDLKWYVADKHPVLAANLC